MKASQYRFFVEYEGWFEFLDYEMAQVVAFNYSISPAMIESYIPGIGWTSKFERPPLKPSGTEARVCEDIAKRQQMGIQKYRTTVTDNPLSLREWLVHAYEECLDQAVYLRRAIEEIDNDGKPTNCELCGNLRKSGSKTHNVDLG